MKNSFTTKTAKLKATIIDSNKISSKKIILNGKELQHTDTSELERNIDSLTHDLSVLNDRVTNNQSEHNSDIENLEEQIKLLEIKSPKISNVTFTFGDIRNGNVEDLEFIDGEIIATIDTKFHLIQMTIDGERISSPIIKTTSGWKVKLYDSTATEEDIAYLYENLTDSSEFSLLFISDGQIEDEVQESYISDNFFKEHFDLSRDGKIYGTRIYKSKAKVSNEQGADYDGLSGSPQSMGEYIKDSVGMTCLPYIEGVQIPIDDFTDKVPMFKKYRCNAFIDENGDVRVKAIQGQPNYKRTFADGEDAIDDCIMKMSFYWKVVEGETYYDYMVSDTKHDDSWLVWGDCIRHDGSISPYFVHSAYFASDHEDNDGIVRPYSLSGQKIKGYISHESQLPTFENTSDELIDNNTYYGRGRHYGTKYNIIAYLGLMQIIKYKTRNLGVEGAPNATNYNKNMTVPTYKDGVKQTTTTNVTVMPFGGKYTNFGNQHRCALESYIENYNVGGTNYSTYYKFDSSILGEDYDGSYFPCAPKFNFTFDGEGKMTQIKQSCLFRVGNYVALRQEYCSNAAETNTTVPSWEANDVKCDINKNVRISKIVPFKVQLEEIRIQHEENVEIIIPSGEYEFYKIYLDGVNEINAFDNNVYYNGSCLDEENTNYHETLRGRAVLTDYLCGSGSTDDIIGLYDGSAMNTTDNKDSYAYVQTYTVTDGVRSQYATYSYDNRLNYYCPWRLEGIELQCGYWIVPNNSFLRGVSSVDENGNITEHKFEIWVAKKNAKKHKLLSTSGTFTSLGNESTTDRTEELSQNYIIMNVDENSLKYIDKDGNYFTGDWGWIGDVEFNQSADGTVIMYPVMRASGMNGVDGSASVNNNWGDHVWGNPSKAANGSTKYTFRELLLLGNCGNGSSCGISCLNSSGPLSYGAWDFASRSV